MTDESHHGDSRPVATDAERRRLAERVREACVAAALRGYEDASMSGLCGEGALEAAVGAIRTADLDSVIENG